VSVEQIRQRRAQGDKAVPVTVSLPGAMLKELDLVVAQADFGSRSDAIQAALIEFLSQQRALRTRNPTQLAVIAVCFNRKDERRIADAKHTHSEVIKSMMHTHLEGDDCVEIFVANGPQQRIQALETQLNSLRGVHLVRRTQIPPHESAG
jgi:CopG family transcriptional regulator, nickel-responsive regulator